MRFKPILIVSLFFIYSVQTNAQDLVGLMFNAYPCQSRFTNQIAYDWEDRLYTVIYTTAYNRTIWFEQNGMLILASSKHGLPWEKDTVVFNADLPSNIPGMGPAARHPSIVAYPRSNATGIAAIWAQLTANAVTQDTVLGEVLGKAGDRYGSYSSFNLVNNDRLYNIPSRIVRSNDGTMYCMVQTRNRMTGALTGDFFMMNSTDDGASWSINHSRPALDHNALPADYVFSEEAISFDASPDGSILFIGFVAFIPVNDTATVTETHFGWTMSTDKGNSWTEPKLYSLSDFALLNTATGHVNTSEGWVYPSIGTVVDGLNQPHFLVSIDGRDTDMDFDSTYVGEVVVDPQNPDSSPRFFALAQHRLPEFHRKIAPRKKLTGPQPVFIIRGEHEWSKSPDGMQLVAKWIDADSVWVTTPAGHPQTMVRDTSHDVFAIFGTSGIGGVEWLKYEGRQYAIHNLTRSSAVDEKFTKMSPACLPKSSEVLDIGIIYTIMATGELISPGQIYPDMDAAGPAELFFLAKAIPTGIEAAPASPVGISLSQNYPNPFNPATTISFTVARAGHAVVKVLNLLGQEVGVAFDGEVEAGTHKAVFDASNLPSGQYMYRLESNGATESRMMTLMK